jgi:hypothetical protein
MWVVAKHRKNEMKPSASQTHMHPMGFPDSRADSMSDMFHPICQRHVWGSNPRFEDPRANAQFFPPCLLMEFTCSRAKYGKTNCVFLGQIRSVGDISDKIWVFTWCFHSFPTKLWVLPLIEEKMGTSTIHYVSRWVVTGTAQATRVKQHKVE